MTVADIATKYRLGLVMVIVLPSYFEPAPVHYSPLGAEDCAFGAGEDGFRLFIRSQRETSVQYRVLDARIALYR
ncbi:MAG: hypothetical protein ACRERU_01190 [Methylococcales bacterium]